ncbi:MAG: hypothetical protein U0Q18_13245 [Bryobacteraceae bacterium]
MRRLVFASLPALAAAVCWAAGPAPLAIVNPIIAQSEGGERLASGFQHVPGEVIFFSFQVEGFKATSADKIRLSYKIQAADPQGVPIMEPIEVPMEETLAPEDKNWKPLVHHEIQIPPLADSGTYKIAVSVVDEIAKATATTEVPFQVRGHRVEPSATLVVRNFHFFRGEQDAEPLQKAAYRPGDEIWARFDIIGYKFGAGNAIDVSYDVSVSSPSGKVMYTQPDAAVDKSQSFYPKRYVPGAMSLKTQSNTRPGEYAVTITVHDRAGNQNYEAHQSFTIE